MSSDSRAPLSIELLAGLLPATYHGFRWEFADFRMEDDSTVTELALLLVFADAHGEITIGVLPRRPLFYGIDADVTARLLGCDLEAVDDASLVLADCYPIDTDALYDEALKYRFSTGLLEYRI